MGREVEIFQDLQTHELRYFVQSSWSDYVLWGPMPPEQKGVPMKIVDVLQRSVGTGYEKGLRYALHDYYLARRKELSLEQAQKDTELQKIRVALGLPKVLRTGLFPDDQRLTKKVKCESASKALLGEILAELSRDTGVRLSADRVLLGREFPRVGKPKVLWTWMETMQGILRVDGIHTSWIAEDDGGYRLILTKERRPRVLAKGLHPPPFPTAKLKGKK